MHSDSYISLLPDKFRTDLLGFQNLIIFIDQLGFIRVYSAAALNCAQIDYGFLIENTLDSKFLVPAIKGMDVLALKLNLYYHIRYRCCGLTYLMQLVDEDFYCRNPRKKASTAIKVCHIFYRRRLIQQQRFVKPPVLDFQRNTLCRQTLMHCRLKLMRSGK